MDVIVTLASKECICYLILMFYSLFQNIFSLTCLFFDNFVCDHLNYCLLRSGSKCPYFCNLQVIFNPFVRNFLGRQRPLKILPTKNLFLGIDLDSMMSKIDLDCFGIH